MTLESFETTFSSHEDNNAKFNDILSLKEEVAKGNDSFPIYSPSSYKELLEIVEAGSITDKIINVDNFSKYTWENFSQWIEKKYLFVSEKKSEWVPLEEELLSLIKDSSSAFLILPNWVILQNYVPTQWDPWVPHYNWNVLFSQEAIWVKFLTDWLVTDEQRNAFDNLLTPYLSSQWITITSIVWKSNETKQLWIWINHTLEGSIEPLNKMWKSSIQQLHATIQIKKFICMKEGYFEQAELLTTYSNIVTSYMSEQWIDQIDWRIPHKKELSKINESIK